MDFDRLSSRYRGSIASGYDKRRTGGKQWLQEQRGIEALLARIPKGSSILDIPAGTGRYIGMYKARGLVASGMDASADMLAEAARKAEAEGHSFALSVGDIRAITAPDGAYDCVLCMRFLNWVDFAGFKVAVGELARVSRHSLILGVRVALDESERGTKRLSLLERFKHARRRRRQLRKGRTRDPHDVHAVEQLFADLHLTVVQIEHLEQRGDNTEYRIYLLSHERRA